MDRCREHSEVYHRKTHGPGEGSDSFSTPFVSLSITLAKHLRGSYLLGQPRALIRGSLVGFLYLLSYSASCRYSAAAGLGAGMRVQPASMSREVKIES